MQQKRVRAGFAGPFPAHAQSGGSERRRQYIVGCREGRGRRGRGEDVLCCDRAVVPAFFTASTHMLKPMKWASMGSLVTRLSFLMKAFQVLMKASLAGLSMDWK